MEGRFNGRTSDKMDMLFTGKDGVQRRVDPFVGCFVLPSDFDPYSQDYAHLIKPEDYQIKEDELLDGEWRIEGKQYGSTFLVHEKPQPTIKT